MFGKKNEKPIEEVNELLRISIAAKDEVIAAWKDRGDRYAAANTELLGELRGVYAMITKALTAPDNDSSTFKKLLEEAIKARPK